MILVADSLNFDVGVGGRLPLAVLGRVCQFIGSKTDGVDVRKSMLIDIDEARLNKDFLKFLDVLFLRDAGDGGVLKLFDDGVFFPLLRECFDVR